MQNLNYNSIKKSDSYHLTKPISLLFLSVISLTCGIMGLVEHKSPQNLQSIDTLMFSIIVYFEYHIITILGAFGISYAVWKIQY
ncbi:MAG: hypothetical protein IME94_03350 [Proteobacteria bacterium]|nr:hypothetical protein [Pseudomonadota bacterium]